MKLKNLFFSLNKYKNTIFCDNAGGSQVPTQVINKVNNFLINSYVQPYNNNKLSKLCTKTLEEGNNIVNNILNNKSGKLVYGSSTTQLVYNLANSIKNTNLLENGEIIVSTFSHESCITPFERYQNKKKIVKYWNLEKTKDDKYNINYDKLYELVNKNTKLVVIPHVSNILGNILDIKTITKEIKKINKNAKIMVDGVAYLPHRLIDVDEYDVDYYIVSFYKFLGLRVSACYIKKDIFPLLNNENHMFFDNNLDNENKLQLGGVNYECFVSLLGISDYLLYLNKLITNNEEAILTREVVKTVMNYIENYENKIVEKFMDNINKNEIDIVTDLNKEMIPLFSCDLKNYNNTCVELILNELDILCKTGTFYCDRLFDSVNLDKSNGLLRLSFMHYNTYEDVFKVINNLNLFKVYKSNFLFNSISYKDYLSSNEYLALKKSFNKLNRDIYFDNERYRNFSLINTKTDNYTIIGDLKFTQSNKINKFNGNIIRDYENINKLLLQNKFLKKLIVDFKSYVRFHYNYTPNMIKIHQIRVCIDGTNNEIVPEGIHNDGYNCIGIFCVNRENITGGDNIIYDDKLKKLHSTILNPGDFLILNDNKLFHYVEKTENINKSMKGYRDMLIFTTVN